MTYSNNWAITVLLVLLTGAVSAQGHHTKVVLPSDSTSTPGDTVDLVRNTIMINPLLLLRGEVPIYYEHSLSRRVSVVVGAGITNRTVLNLAHSQEQADDYSAGTRLVTKPSFHAGLRYYLTKDMEVQGFYVQGSFVYLDHAKDIVLRDAQGRFTEETLRDESIYKDERLYFGYQRLASTSNWLFDVYCGVGLRGRQLNQVNERLDLGDGLWTHTQVAVQDHILAYFLGVKVGYGF